jgi:hypothetical protein
MTGGEIVAGAKVGRAAAKAAKKAADEDAQVKARLLATAADGPVMGVAAEAYAKRILVRQALMLKLFSPLANWMGFKKEFFETTFPEEMARRTDGIPDERLTDPIPSVAVPAIEGLGYSIDEPDLREMYLNLLVTASDRGRRDQAHPSFASIIKQLSAPEAAMLLRILGEPQIALVRILFYAAQTPGGGFSIVQTNTIDTASLGSPQAEQRAVALWLDNWARLGLVELTWAESLVAPADSYEWAEELPTYQSLKSVDPQVGRGEISRGIARVTELGRTFGRAVSPDPSVPVLAGPDARGSGSNELSGLSDPST